MTARNPPTAAGSFDKTPLSHVLVYLHDKRLTGSLEIRSEGRTDLVHVQEGFPTRVRLDEPVEPLGRVLLELDLIDETAYTRSLQALASGAGLQGRILVQQGALDLPGLIKGLREQVRRKLVRLFSIHQAEYGYWDGENLLEAYGGEESIRVDPYPILLAGVRFAYRDDRLDLVLRRLAGLAMRVAPGTAVADRFGLRDEERRLIELMQQAPRALEEVTGAGLLAEVDAKALCYCLVLTHSLELVRHVPGVSPPAAAASAPAAPTPAVRAPSAPRLPAVGRKPSKPQVPAAEPGTPPELKALRQEIVARAESLDTQDYFVMLGATQEDGEEALREKYFALAKKFHPDRVPPGLEDLRETLDYVFSNLTEAYSTLTDAEKRTRYVEIAKDGSGTIAGQRRIQTIVDSAMSLQKAEVLLRRRNFDEAEQYCRAAMEGNPEDGEAMALLGWIGLHRREVGAPLNDVLELLHKAIKLSPDSEKVNFYLGTALKRNGDQVAALGYFRRAAELNPRNLDAAREVRLFEMRKEKRTTIPPGGEAHKAPAREKGILDKLFGKK